jgi:hypothetical protein
VQKSRKNLKPAGRLRRPASKERERKEQEEREATSAAASSGAGSSGAGLSFEAAEPDEVEVVGEVSREQRDEEGRSEAIHVDGNSDDETEPDDGDSEDDETDETLGGGVDTERASRELLAQARGPPLELSQDFD